MKLYIFRCKAAPKTYGATRYETASNLPAGSCSGGWEFFERVDLTGRSTLRYAVDTAEVRRNVRSRGWHIWNESAASLRREPDAKAWRDYERPQPEPEVVPFEKTVQPLPKSTPEAPPPPREQWRPSPEPDPIGAETEVVAAKAAAAPEPIQRPSAPTPRPPAPPPPQPPPAPVPVPPPPAPTYAAKTTPRFTGEMVSSEPRPKAPAAPAPPPPPPPEPKLPEPARAKPLHHQVVWFDIPVRDIDRAVRFYSAVLGISLKKEQAGPGAAVAALPHAEGAIGGSLVQNMDAKPSESGPLLYLNANGRLDEALMAVEKHGGKILAEKHSIAPFGFRAVVVDCEGNRIALHSM
jgi:predicted enzyme related to lactoylglutathione lyase